MRRGGVTIFAQHNMIDLFCNPCYIAPRAANEDEIGDLYDFIEKDFDVTRSDAQGIVDCFTLAIFDDGEYMLPNFTGKVMAAFSNGKPNEVFLFTWQGDKLSMARRYLEA